jgi:hypothetical protein
VLVAEEGAERWEAVSPALQARDASADGRAIRWMIAAGGPGTGLADLGEGADANLATARAMGEQRRRFLRRRQDYFAFILADILVHAANRARRYGRRSGRAPLREVTLADIQIHVPDISPEDNESLATAAATLIGGLLDLGRIIGVTPQFRATALRLFMKFAGEQMSDDEAAALLEEEVRSSELRSSEGVRSSELRSSEGVRSSELRSSEEVRSSELRSSEFLVSPHSGAPQETPNSELRTSNSEPSTSNSEPSTSNSGRTNAPSVNGHHHA